VRPFGLELVTDLERPRVVGLERRRQLIEQPRLVSDVACVVAGQPSQLLSGFGAWAQRGQMIVVGAEKRGEHPGIKRIALGAADPEPVPRSVQGLGVDWEHHHSVVQQEVDDPAPGLLVAAVGYLESLDVPAYKIASFELLDTRLLQRVAATGKPVILSTGMATRDEIDQAVATLAQAGCRELALLKCTSAYPAPVEKMNLRTIPDLAARFGVPVGLSDHSMHLAVRVVAVALAATVIEKRLTLSRSVPGPDGAFSLKPHEFREVASAVRAAEQALGRVAYGPAERESLALRGRRSLRGPRRAGGRASFGRNGALHSPCRQAFAAAPVQSPRPPRRVRHRAGYTAGVGDDAVAHRRNRVAELLMPRRKGAKC